MNARAKDSSQGVGPGTLKLLRSLMIGKEHDRHSAAKYLGVQPAAADRCIKQLLKNVPGVLERREQRKRIICFRAESIFPPNLPTVVAACFGASIAPLFRGSVYEQRMNEALRIVLGRARRKDLFKGIERKFYFVRGPGDHSIPGKADILDELIDAVLVSEEVEFTYKRFQGGEDRVRVMPLTIAIYQHQFYLLGRNEHHRVYAYRFARIREVERIDGARFDYPLDHDPDSALRDSIGIFLSEDFPVEDVALRLSSKWADYAASHKWHDSQKMESKGAEVVLRLRVKTCPELEAWILGFGEDAEVLAPTSLRDRVARRIAAMYQKAGERGTGSHQRND